MNKNKLVALIIPMSFSQNIHNKTKKKKHKNTFAKVTAL